MAPTRPLNVRDYGAKGDGSTNDDLAFSLAFAAFNAVEGQILEIPRGTYQTAEGATYTLTGNYAPPPTFGVAA